MEIFTQLAETGSIAATAQRTELSQPTVSQQIKNLENALGAALVDHTKRPMQLTPAGRTFLTRSRAILGELRQAKSDLATMDLSQLRELKLGIIDDFDNDVTPRLATDLAHRLSRCHLTLLTGPSFDILQSLVSGKIQLGIAASAGKSAASISEDPVMCDPFVFVAPRDAGSDPITIMGELPFLSYEKSQLIARQIENHMTACGQKRTSRFEIAAHLALMALSSRGAGWAVTTAAGYLRAARMHDRLAAHPLPFEPFSRQISLFSRTDVAPDLAHELGRTLRRHLENKVRAPGTQIMPWLSEQLCVLDPDGQLMSR